MPSFFYLFHGQVAGQHITCMVKYNEKHAMTFISHLNCFYASLRAGCSKILPATEISIIPSPTKPLIAGSWPVPPKVTIVTRSASANLLVYNEVSLLQSDDIRIR